MKLLAFGCVALALCIVGQTSAAEVVHRWSFEADANDSAGSAHGTLLDGATAADGKLDLDGEGGYVELPIGETIAGLTNATVEAWVTWDEEQGAWARIFDFGAGQNAYMFLTPRHGRAEGDDAEDSIRFAITSNGFGEEQQLTGPAQFPIGEETHVAVTIDAENDVVSLYVNGELVATQEGVTLSPSDLGNTTNNWLGVGQFYENETDPFFNGSISEFRIHDAALTAEEIANSFQLGPDKLVADAPTARMAADGSAGMTAGGSACCCQPTPCCGQTHRRSRGRLFGGLFGRRCR